MHELTLVCTKPTVLEKFFTIALVKLSVWPFCTQSISDSHRTRLKDLVSSVRTVSSFLSVLPLAWMVSVLLSMDIRPEMYILVHQVFCSMMSFAVANIAKSRSGFSGLMSKSSSLAIGSEIFVLLFMWMSSSSVYLFFYGITIKLHWRQWFKPGFHWFHLIRWKANPS